MSHPKDLFFKYLIHYLQSVKTRIYMEAESLFLSNKKSLCWKLEAENVENKILFTVDIQLKYVW